MIEPQGTCSIQISYLEKHRMAFVWVRNFCEACEVPWKGRVWYIQEILSDGRIRIIHTEDMRIDLNIPREMIDIAWPAGSAGEPGI